MKNKFKLVIQSLIVITIMLSFQACSIKLPMELKNVEESTNSYEITSENDLSKEITFKNNLPKNYTPVTGLFASIIHLQQDKKDIKGYDFIKNAIVNEFKARNLPIRDVNASSNSLLLDNFQLYTHRSSGFSPLVTFSMLKVTVKMDGQEKSFSSVIKRGKVPVWSFNEVIDPCFNEPISLLVKEVVAKINKEYFNYKLSDKKVFETLKKIEKGIETKDKLNYLNVYELGFSNNKKALDGLIKYSSNPDEYLRLASISMLGLIGEESQFEYLVSKYRNSKVWQDRALALKAILDIDNEEAKNFVDQEHNMWKNQDNKEGRWHTLLLDSYKIIYK